MVQQQPMVVDREGKVWSPQGQVGYADDKQFFNSLGALQTVSTLTAILPTIIQQKYYTVPVADYVDVEVGTGNPFSATLFNWSTGIKGGDFESGLINMASNDSNKVGDDIFVEPITRKVIGWKKDVTYNIIQEGTFAAGTQNMDLIQAKYQARKKEYDLGIQKTAFFGLTSNTTDFAGLLNLSTVNINTTLITKKLSEMTAAEFNAVLGGLIPDYMNNCNYTAVPNRLLIPASDYYALTTFTSETFPLPGSTRLEVLQNALKAATGQGDFKVLPLAYADQTRNASITGLNKNRYVLYKKAPDTVIMNVPLYFTVTLPGTANSFDYTSAAYSRFTGVNAFRPLEIRYLDSTSAST
jgi:hypothetical protein